MTPESRNFVKTELSAGRYLVTSELGAGGMAFVYLALDRKENRQVVIKVPRQAMLDDPEFAGRFQREIKSLFRLNHPNIAKILDVGEHDGKPFVVLEYLSGGSLRDRMKNGPRPVEELQTWLPGIASALDFCHENECVHRDVKPDNILFDGKGKAYLSDFGIAKVMSKAPKTRMTVLTGAGLVLGTAQYMAPELVLGYKYDGKVDQYALAVTIYECLAGRVPVQGPSPAAILVEQASKPPQKLCTLVPWLPRGVSDAVHRALAKDPGERFQSCQSLSQTSLQALKSQLVQATVLGQAGIAAGKATQIASTPHPGERSIAKAESVASRQSKGIFAFGAIAVFGCTGTLALLICVLFGWLFWAADSNHPADKKNDQAKLDKVGTPIGEPKVENDGELNGGIDPKVPLPPGYASLRIPFKPVHKAGVYFNDLVENSVLFPIAPFRPGWTAAGPNDSYFARLKGPGEMIFPSIRTTRFVSDIEIELLGKGMRMDVRWSQKDDSLWLGCDWEGKNQRYFLWRQGPDGGSGSQSAPDLVPMGKRFRFQLIVADGRYAFFGNSKQLVEFGRVHPIDLTLRFVVLEQGEPDVLITRCAFRALRKDEWVTAKWDLCPAQLTLDVDTAKKRIAKLTAGLPSKPQVSDKGERFAPSTTLMPMTWIPPGEFDMGSSDPMRKDSEPRHRVQISKGFWMGQMEVTQGEWKSVMGSDAGRIRGSPLLPVDGVSWEQARDFCKNVTLNEQQAGRLPPGHVYRLPTEAEWEYACRAGSNKDFSVDINSIWTSDTSLWKPHQVGESLPNAWGLYDMHGNVCEWCFDRWQDIPKVGKLRVDPVVLGRVNEDSFVIRGGGWWDETNECRSSARYSGHSSPGGFRGFRIVLGPMVKQGSN